MGALPLVFTTRGSSCNRNIDARAISEAVQQGERGRLPSPTWLKEGSRNAPACGQQWGSTVKSFPPRLPHFNGIFTEREDA